MGHHMLAVALALVYGPLAAILVLYVAAVILRASGRPGLLQELVKRTSVPEPVRRKGGSPH